MNALLVRQTSKNKVYIVCALFIVRGKLLQFIEYIFTLNPCSEARVIVASALPRVRWMLCISQCCAAGAAYAV